MRKIKKLIFNLILFLFYTNIVIARTNGTYVASESNYLKRFLVSIGIVLIIAILYLGYKLDKKEEIRQRKEKYKKDDYAIKTNNKLEENESEPLEEIKSQNKTYSIDDTIMINYAKLKKIEKETVEESEENFEQKEKTKIDSTMIIKKVDEDKKEQ